MKMYIKKSRNFLEQQSSSGHFIICRSSSNSSLFIDIKEEEFDQMKEIAVEILKSMSQQYKE